MIEKYSLYLAITIKKTKTIIFICLACCFQNQVQTATAQWMMYIEIAETIPSVLVTLVLGPISDIKGRKFALILPLIGSSIMSLIFILTETLNWPYAVAIVALFMNGILGSAALLFTAAFSYIGDVSSREDTVMRMAILDTVYTLASAVAMIYMGYIINGLGFAYAFLFLIGLNILNMLYVIFIMPESIKNIKDLKEMTNPAKHIQKAFIAITKPTIKENGWKIRLSITTNTVIIIASMGAMRMQSLFAMDEPLCWGSVLIGYHGAVNTIITNVCKLLLAAYAIPKITEIGSIILGLVSGAISMILQSVAVKTWIMFIGK